MLAAFCFPALAYLAAGAMVAALSALGLADSEGNWLALHLVFVGGISQVLLGAAQFFSSAFLATEPPSARSTRLLLYTWNAGTLLVAIGVPTGAGLISGAGGVLLLAGLGMYVAALRGLERRSLQTARWTLRWYYASAAFLAVGAVLGASVATGAIWTHGSLTGAHLACNLAGWFGGAIVGTLHTFYPSLTHTQLQHQRLQGPTFLTWYGGTAGLAGGELFGASPLSWAGLLLLGAASVMLSINVVACARIAQPPVGLPARLVGAAQLFLVAGMVTAALVMLAHGSHAVLLEPWRTVLGVLFGAGWIGLTFIGSLIQLLTVLTRVRDLGASLPLPSPRRDTLLATLLTGSVALLALAQAAEIAALIPVAVVLTLVFAAPVLARAAQLTLSALLAPRRARRAV